MSSFFNYIYDINLFLVIISGIFLCLYKPSKIKTILFLALTSSFMFFIFASRYGIGFDYFNYYNLFNESRKLSWVDLIMLKGPTEPGFALILKFISLFTTDIVVMYVFLGIITFSLISIYIYKNSSSPFISMYLFITLGFLFGVMNLFRQYFSAIVFLFAIKYIQKRKFLPFLGVLLLTASIHKSVLIILPVYFIATLSVNWKSLSFYGALTIFAYIFCDYFINFITQYVYKEYNLETGELSSFMAGLPWQFVLIPFIYCLTAILMKNKLLARNPENIVLINFSIYTLMAWVMLTRHLLLERPANFLYISAIILGVEIVNCFNPDHSMKSKVAEIKQSISEMKKNNVKGKALEVKYHELNKAQEELSESKSYYVLSIVVIILIGFFNQVFAISRRNHNVSPYRSIFTEERNIEREESIKQIGNTPNE